jgi:ribosomal protein S18 acetylase RimI-like enzyme
MKLMNIQIFTSKENQTLEFLKKFGVRELSAQYSDTKIFHATRNTRESLLLASFQQFDSQILQQSVWRIDRLGFAGDEKQVGEQEVFVKALLERVDEECFQKKRGFLSFRIHANEIALLHLLEKCEFHVIENLLTFHSLYDDRIDDCSLSEQFELRSLRDRHDDSIIQQLYSLGETCFKLSRYHLDFMIEPKYADTLKAVWVRNACFDEHKHVYYAYDPQNHRAVGFVICKIGIVAEQRSGILELIGVAPEYHRRGIGKGLVRQFGRFCQEYNLQHGYVGTQSTNVPSVNLYTHSGFALKMSRYTLHRHYKETAMET